MRSVQSARRLPAREAIRTKADRIRHRAATASRAEARQTAIISCQEAGSRTPEIPEIVVLIPVKQYRQVMIHRLCSGSESWRPQRWQREHQRSLLSEDAENKIEQNLKKSGGVLQE